MQNFTQRHRVLPCLPYATGTADRNSITVDRRGYDAVSFYVQAGSLVGLGGVLIKVQGSADDATWHDLTNAEVSLAPGDEGNGIVIDVNHPADRYLRLAIDKNSEDSAESGVAFLYRATTEPAAQPSFMKRVYVHAPAAAS